MKMNTIPLIVLLLTLLACGEKPLGPAGGNGSTPSTPATPAASEKVGEPLSAWQEGQMDIHFINTTTGECVFVIAPDGTQILIDAAGSLVSTGQVNSSVTNTGIRARWDPTKDPDYRTGKFIAGYLAKCMAWTGNDKIDYVVNTHFHNDHFGGYSKSLPVSDKSDTYRKQSLPEILDTYPVGTLLDRGWPDYMYPYDVRKLASNGDAIDNYVKAVQWHAAHTGLQAARFVAGSKDQVVLKRKAAAYPSFVFRNIAVNGEIWDGGQTTTATATFPAASEIQVANPADPGNADKCPAENHCSCVMKISYGAFDFFEGGDAQYNGMSSFPWKDMETPVAKAAGAVEVMKADHHGVTNTNGSGFTSSVTGKTAEAMRYLRPRCWIVNSWTDGHPRQPVYEGVMGTMPGTDAYITNVCDAMGSYAEFSRVKGSNGHIVVRVYDGGATYRVYVLSDSDGKMTVKSISNAYKSV